MAIYGLSPLAISERYTRYPIAKYPELEFIRTERRAVKIRAKEPTNWTLRVINKQQQQLIYLQYNLLNRTCS